MKKKEDVDYIYCKVVKGQKKVKWKIQKTPGLSILQITFGEIKKKKFECEIWRVIRRFSVQNAVVNADTPAAEQLEIQEMLWEAKREEFMCHRAYIMDQLLEKTPYAKEKNGDRRKLVMVIRDDAWNPKNLLMLFLVAKDRFEEMFLVADKESQWVTNLLKILYQEWGIVLHVYTEDEMWVKRMDHFDVAIFLVDRWDRKYTECIYYETGYLVMGESEETCKTNGRKLYSGLRYEWNGKKMPKEYGRLLSVQRPEQYHKKQVSVVDICPIEW